MIHSCPGGAPMSHSLDARIGWLGPAIGRTFHVSQNGND